MVTKTKLFAAFIGSIKPPPPSPNIAIIPPLVLVFLVFVLVGRGFSMLTCERDKATNSLKACTSAYLFRETSYRDLKTSKRILVLYPRRYMKKCLILLYKSHSATLVIRSATTYKKGLLIFNKFYWTVPATPFYEVDRVIVILFFQLKLIYKMLHFYSFLLALLCGARCDLRRVSPKWLTSWLLVLHPPCATK